MFSTGQLMGGTFDEVPARNAELSTLLAAGKVRRGANGTCTLLGPEGPGAAPAFGWVWWLTLWAPFGVSLWGDVWGYRPYFENYTVDASILETMRKHRFTNE